MAWLPAIATIASSIIASEGQEDTNNANMQIAQNNTAFNAQEAAITREFNAMEAAKSREWGSDEATRSREFNAGQTDRQRNFANMQADKQMDFQERMANSSWTRGVIDLRNAGLNPMLAYRMGGAQAPSGAMGQSSAASSSPPSGATASGQAATAGQPGNQMNPYAAAGANATQWAQIQNIQQDTARKEAETRLIDSQARGYEGEQNVRMDLMRKQAEQQVKLADLTHEQRKRVEKEIDLVLAQTRNQDADTALKKVNEVLQKYDIPRMKAEADYFKSEVGRTSPHNKYGPQTPFRFLEGLGERYLNKNSAFELKYDTPNLGQKYHPQGRIR